MAMKKCLKCNSTYSDETLTFCLLDGSILSDPYDPCNIKTEQITEIIEGQGAALNDRENAVSPTEPIVAQVIRKDGSIEDCISIGTWNGVFEIAKDVNGSDRRQVYFKDVSRIDIIGPSKIMENGRLMANIWAKAKIHLRRGQILENVYINAVGNLYYKTNLWGCYIDDNVIAITFNS
jgi:hypothetical protein